MVAFLRWTGSIAKGTLNGIAMLVLFMVIVAGVLVVIGLVEGDGLPKKMVLGLDLRSSLADSSNKADFGFGGHAPTVMDIVLALDRAGRDSRVKGAYMRIGTGDISIAEAEEIGAAIARFRATGKFVVAQANGFLSQGLGDYLTAASANDIWMQPKSPFGTAGTGAGAVFLRGLFDKIQAVPQIVKRADYKSAADEYMEKDYTGPDREQMTALLHSWYDNGVAGAAADRKLDPKAVVAAFEKSPQFAEDAKRDGLVDHLGYDDDAEAAARARSGAAKLVSIGEYARATEEWAANGSGPHVALIEGAGEIVDGSTEHGGAFSSSSVIAGDDFAEAIRKATKDASIKAILFRIDSPGGSVTASDQILDAVKKARAAGKPVIVSMGPLAASGGYYVACDADKIVAEPATITGSIGVLTGKVSFGKSLGLLGVGAGDIGVGKNALFESALTPYTPDQLANLNAQADAIYADFMQKVAAGRKLPLANVEAIAKGRVWTGADAKPRGLVDELGTFWTAADDVSKAIGASANQRLVFKRFPEREGLFEAIGEMIGGTFAGARVMEGLAVVAQAPAARAVLGALEEAPRGGVEMRATNLPVQ